MGWDKMGGWKEELNDKRKGKQMNGWIEEQSEQPCQTNDL